MWQMYRQVAAIIHEPDLAAEAHLRALIAEYRRFRHGGNAKPASPDPHELAMDYV
jgi:hypothetical protein